MLRKFGRFSESFIDYVVHFPQKFNGLTSVTAREELVTASYCSRTVAIWASTLHILDCVVAEMFEIVNYPVGKR